MANVKVSGSAIFSDGSAVPLENSSTPEGTLTEILTDATYTVVAQSLGTYAPGKTLTGFQLVAENNVSYAYILRRGLPIMFGSVAKNGVIMFGNKTYPKSVTLEPGDQVMMLAQVAGNRTCSFVVHCSDGTERVFSVTPSGAGTHSLTDTITGNDIGLVLTGKTITQAMALSVDGAKIISGGVVIINAQGSVVSVTIPGSPLASQVCYSPIQARIGLNFDAQIVTDA